MTQTRPTPPVSGPVRRSFLLRTAGIIAAAVAAPVFLLRSAVTRRPRRSPSAVQVHPHTGSVPRTTRKSDTHG